jgi:hypothetical protein
VHIARCVSAKYPSAKQLLKTSTWVIIAGVGLIFVPIPPFATISGIVAMGVGGVMKLLGL